MQTIERLFHFSAIAFWGFATLVALLSAIVIVAYWGGVREFLLGS